MALPNVVLMRGLRSAQPAATAVANGTVYYVTDETVQEQSNGTAWVFYSDSNPFYNAGNSGAALTLDWANGHKQRLTLTATCTLTLSNPSDGNRYVLHVSTGAGSFNLVWPGAVLWSGGVAPTITVTASKVDIIVLIYSTTTGKYYGAFTQNY